VCFVAYLAAAEVLYFHFRSSVGDAQSRLSNAYYVLFSRDPHMAAVGFVWNPLPSWAELPLVAFKDFLPYLTRDELASFIVSAAAMAMAVVELSRLLSEAGVGVAVRRTLVALFALQPMIFYYGANGMSEALELCFTIATARYLARWVRSRSTLSLVAAGICLALIYLTREEGAAAALVSMLGVAGLSLLRSADQTPSRSSAWSHRFSGWRVALVDTTIFIAPFVLVFVGWAVVSWIIVGHPFEAFSSKYGNSSQVQIEGAAKAYTGYTRYRDIVLGVLGLAPLAPLVIPAAIVADIRRRTMAMLAPLSLLGGILVFTIASTAKGQTFGWLRLYITGIPLTFVAVGLLLGPLEASRRTNSVRRRVASPRMRMTVTCIAAALLVLPSFATTAWAISASDIGREDHLHLEYVFNRRSTSPDRYVLDSVARLASMFNHMNLPSGSILVDTIAPCVPYIYLAVDHPKVFIITNDRDFQKTLADPSAFHVRYMLAEPAVGIGGTDSLNQAYPGLYDNGGGVATLAFQLTNTGECPPFRLYKVLPTSA